LIQIRGANMTQILCAGFDQVGTRVDTVHSAKILIIEDQLPVCELYALALRLSSHRYDIRLAHSGEAGVEAAFKDRPDLVIMDLTLPRMSGVEVAEKLTLGGILPGVPLIIASGETADVTEQIPANAYLAKPFPMANLVAAVQDALNALVV